MKRFFARSLFACILLPLAFLPAVFAQDSLHIRSVGAQTLPANGALDVAMLGDLAVVAGGMNGVFVVNIAQPASPQLLATYDTPGMARKVVVRDSIAYIADGSAGLLLLSLVNPSQPAPLGTFATTDFSQAIRITGDTVYLGGADQLRIVSVLDPANPQLLGSYNPPGSISDLQVRDSLVYLTGLQNGLRIVNCSNPAQPVPIGQLNSRSNAFAVCIADTLAYVADYTAGLTIFSIADPTAPRIVGFYDTPGTANGIANRNDGTICVSDFDRGIRWLDGTNPEQPSEIGYFNTPGSSYGVAMWNQYFVVADLAALRIYEPVFDQVESPFLSQLPHKVTLHNAYPNPFNATTTISYSLPYSSQVNLELFDIEGHLVQTLFSGDQSAGVHTLKLDAAQLAAGVYFYRLVTGHQVKANKVVVLK